MGLQPRQAQAPACSTSAHANGIADAMAEMVPEALPAASTAGEKRVFSALERLPDDCLVYLRAGRPEPATPI